MLFSKNNGNKPEQPGSYTCGQSGAAKGEQHFLVGPFCHLLGLADLVQPAALQKGDDLLIALDIKFLFLLFHPKGKPNGEGKQNSRQGNSPPSEEIGQGRPDQQAEDHHQGKNIAEPVKGPNFFRVDFLLP